MIEVIQVTCVVGVSVVTTAAAVASLIWLILRLLIEPLRSDIVELKNAIKSIRPVDDLERRIALAVSEHARSCMHCDEMRGAMVSAAKEAITIHERVEHSHHPQG